MGRRNGTPDDNEESRRNPRRRGFHLGRLLSGKGQMTKLWSGKPRRDETARAAGAIFVLVHCFGAVKSTSVGFCRLLAEVVDNHDGHGHFLPLLLRLCLLRRPPSFIGIRSHAILNLHIKIQCRSTNRIHIFQKWKPAFAALHLLLYTLLDAWR